MNELSVSSINDRASEEYFRRGHEAEQHGLPEKAAEYYERALGENPDNEKACFALAILYDRAPRMRVRSSCTNASAPAPRFISTP